MAVMYDTKLMGLNGVIDAKAVHPGTILMGVDGEPMVVKDAEIIEVPSVRLMFKNGEILECSWAGSIRNEEGVVAYKPAKPLDFKNDTPLPIHPYVLGILLADGCFRRNKPALYNTEQSIIRKVRKLLPDGEVMKYKYGSAIFHNGVIREYLEKAGLWGLKSPSKFIPHEYLYASPDDRLELLRGLIDGDGYIASRKSIEYVTTSPHLAKEVRYLAKSLCCSVYTTSRRTYYKKDGKRVYCNRSWRVFISTEDVVPISSSKHRARYPRYPSKWRNPITLEENTGVRKCMRIGTEKPYLTADLVPVW